MGQVEFKTAVDDHSAHSGGEEFMETVDSVIWKVTPQTSHIDPLLIVTQSDEFVDAAVLANQVANFEIHAIERVQYAQYAPSKSKAEVYMESIKNEPISGN